MSRVTREIFIAAPPEIVRRHLLDPERRRGWLDDEDADPAPGPDGDLTYTHDDGADTSHVRIEILPEDGGTRVRVTEELEGTDDRSVEGVEDARGDVVSLSLPWADPSRIIEAPVVGGEERPRMLVRAA